MKYPIIFLRCTAIALLCACFSSVRSQTIPASSTATSASTTLPSGTTSTPTATKTVGAIPLKIASGNNSPEGRKAAMDAAGKALDLAKIMQADEFLSADQHATVAKDLTTLASAANDVSHDDGKNPNAFKASTRQFLDAVNRIISRLNTTARQAKESDANKAKCSQWSGQWTKIRMSFQPAAKTAQQASADALNLVKTMQADEFLSADQHATVAKELTALESTANDVSHDDGKDSDASKVLSGKFVDAINQMISRLNSTARRAQESDENKAKCNQWSADWTKIRISFRPNFENTPAPNKATVPGKTPAGTS